MVDRHATRSDEFPSDDDFEWVNAWAASTTQPEPRIEPPAAEADPLPRTADNEVPTLGSAPDTEASTPATAPEAAEPEAVSLVPVAETAPPDVEALEPPAPADHIDAAEASIADDRGPLAPVAEAVDRALDAPPPRVSRWLERRPWTRVFRVVARNPAPPVATIHLVEPMQSSDTQTADSTSRVAEPTQDLPQPAEAELTPTLVEPVLALDQLERDIEEIEWIRDRLLAEPIADAAPLTSAKATVVARRTSDHVPILVGGALALTLLIVFGAAASLASLR
jgi:hypothetical protein